MEQMNEPKNEQETPFDFIEQCDTKTLCAVLQQEDPLIIPPLLRNVSLPKAAELLQMLPDRIRFQVIENLVQGNKESEDEAEHIAADIRNKIELYMIAPYSSELGGIDFLEKIIGLTDSRFTENVLSFLEKTNYEAYTALRERIFLFEDIALLHNHSIIKLLREIDKEDFLQAFSVPCPAVQEKMERNMSKGAAAVKEELDYMGPVPIQEVRASRQKIIEQLRQLVERGEIVLQYTDAELFLMQKKTIFKATASNRKTV